MRGSRNFCQGGIQARRPENSLDNVSFFLFLSLLYSLQRRSKGFIAGKTILSQGSGEGSTFPGRGQLFFMGGPIANFYRNPYNLWFSRGVWTPYSSSGSAHDYMEIQMITSGPYYMVLLFTFPASRTAYYDF